MKNALIVLFAGLVLLAGCSAYGTTVQGGAVVGGSAYPGLDYGYFYDYLSPYGTWVEYSPWGYVWCPAGLGFGWRPYTYGQWLWTVDGWMWDSTFDWGWIPFHYGRWGWDEGLGWFWVPGSIWGPAWVTWAWTDYYVGWAPLPPGLLFEAGAGIVGRPEIPIRHWSFVDGRRFLDRDVNRIVLPYERNAALLGRVVSRRDITVQNRGVFNPGIGMAEARRLTNRSIIQYGLRDAERPGRVEIGSGEVRVYRPPVGRETNIRPRAVLPRDEAVRRLPEMRQEGRGSAPTQGPASRETLSQQQNRERQLLERSQQQEMNTLRRNQQEEAAKARTEADRAKIRQQYQQRMEQTRRRQAEEANQMRQRHQQEQTQATRSRPRKKTP